MTTLREAAQQALEALEYYRSGEDYKPTPASEAITALRAALAEPVQEPVAKVELMTTGGNAGLATRIVEIDDHLRDRLRPGQLLYTSSPQRKPLTEEQKLDLVTNWFSEDWAIKNALGLLGDYDTVRAHGIGEQAMNEKPEALRLAELLNEATTVLDEPFHHNAIAENCDKAAAELRRLHEENERLREENVYLKEALWAAANKIEKLAFQLPAPNKQAPEFMMLAISIRKIVQGQEQPR